MLKMCKAFVKTLTLIESAWSVSTWNTELLHVRVNPFKSLSVSETNKTVEFFRNNRQHKINISFNHLFPSSWSTVTNSSANQLCTLDPFNA